MFYEYKHGGTGDYYVKEYGINFVFPPHLHNSFEFITALSGSITVTIDGKKHTLSKGWGVLIFPNQLHSITSTESEHMLCIFSPELVNSFTSHVKNSLPKSNLFSPGEDIISKLNEHSQDIDLITKKALLYSLCATFNKTATYQPATRESTDLLSTIFAFVENNYQTDCTLKQLAQAIGYDYAYLSKYFKRTTGICFSHYLNQFRLSRARYLLSSTDIPIVQCALDVGYNSLRTFNISFKKEYSTTPSSYRKSGIIHQHTQ